MNLVLIGTDHRLQHAIVRDDVTKAWLTRDGGCRYRRLVAYCIEKLDVRAILEETHADQEQTAPTIAYTLAKEHGLVWQTLGLGEIGTADALFDPPIAVALGSNVRPELLAGIYDLEFQRIREASMFMKIMNAIRIHNCVLAVVGYVHLGVLARLFESERISVKPLLFTFPLVVDETKS